MTAALPQAAIHTHRKMTRTTCIRAIKLIRSAAHTRRQVERSVAAEVDWIGLDWTGLDWTGTHACERSETSKSISTEMPSSSAAASAFGFAELGSPSTAE
jgi:hypothetical protein